MGWFESPQYMKNMQKIAAMRPEDQAVNQVLIEEMHRMYPDADMRKQLRSMHMAATDKARERSYGLGKERQALSGELGRGRLELSGELGRGRYGLAKDAYDFGRGEDKTAEALGYGNIALSGLRGYADMRNRKKLAGQLTGITDWINKQR